MMVAYMKVDISANDGMHVSMDEAKSSHEEIGKCSEVISEENLVPIDENKELKLCNGIWSIEKKIDLSKVLVFIGPAGWVDAGYNL